MKLTFEEEQFLKGIKILQKGQVIERIKNINADSEDLKEVKEDLLIKLENLSQSEMENLIMAID